jgi:hypothetical protein
LKAFVDQTKGTTLSEISKLICCALLLTLALRSGPACEGSPGPAGTPAPGAVPEAGTVQFFNCNHDNSANGLPGRAYNVYSRVDDGAWVPRGGLNLQPGDWTDCHDVAHQAASLSVNMSTIQQGKWEFRMIKLPLPGEPDCDSYDPPDTPGGCSTLPLTSSRPLVLRPRTQ